jgi:hypothetical protein
MAARYSGLVLYVFVGIFFARPVAAQGTDWRIDSVQSTARLYVTSSNRREARVNVGVARLSGDILQGAGSVLPATVAFQIYPADRNGKPHTPQGSAPAPHARTRPGSTTLAFQSKNVELLDQKTVLVRGDLTATYVSQTQQYDPSKGYTGPVYGPPVLHSVKREVGFVFRATASAGMHEAKKGSVEWSASSVIPGDLFPELWNAVLTTNWPAFTLNEQCAIPSTVGEDFSGPACTGKVVEPAPRTDIICAVPSIVGEDFSGVTCSGTPLSAVEKPEGHSRPGGNQPTKNSPGIMANEVVIELVLRLVRVNPEPQKSPSSNTDPTARNYLGNLPEVGSA